MAPFSGTEIRAARNLMAALECFKELRNTMPMQYVLTFLLIGTEEGLTVGEYAKKGDVSPSVVSRHILDLGIRQRNKNEEGFGLAATRPKLENLREHTVHLTDKGRALFHRVVRVLQN